MANRRIRKKWKKLGAREEGRSEFIRTNIIREVPLSARSAFKIIFPDYVAMRRKRIT